jgi:SPP1 gp7 family putative phage head morphogenesis protein
MESTLLGEDLFVGTLLAEKIGITSIIRGGPGSGSWDGPGRPRFAHEYVKDRFDKEISKAESVDHLTNSLKKIGLTEVFVMDKSFKTFEEQREFTSKIGNEFIRMKEQHEVLDILKKNPLNSLSVTNKVGVGNLVPPDVKKNIGNSIGAYTPNIRSMYVSKGGEKELSSIAPSFGEAMVGRTATDTFRHELGHHIYAVSNPSGSEKRTVDMISEFKDTCFSILVKPDGAERMARGLSVYAITNIDEAFAETFSAYTHPGYGKNGKMDPELEKFASKYFPKPVEKKSSFKNDHLRGLQELEPKNRPLPVGKVKSGCGDPCWSHMRNNSLFKMGIQTLIKGGSGSGNFGHSGRPGLVGGSAPGEGSASFIDPEEKNKYMVGKKDPDVSVIFKRGTEDTFIKSLTVEESKALSEYKGDDPYAPGAAIALNGMMREGEKLSEEQKKAIEQIDSAFRKAPRLKEDIILYRGTDSTMKTSPSGFIDSKAYISTSINRKEAENFAGLVSGGKGYVYEIKVPKGFVAIPTSYFHTGTSISEEKEVLLPRGIAILLKSIKGNEIKAEVVGGEFWMRNINKGTGILSLFKGGPGSGHFGHEGRPGQVGGSASGEGSQLPESRPQTADDIKMGPTMGRGWLINTNNSLIDVTSDFGGGTNDHVGIFIIEDYGEELGLSKEDVNRLKKMSKEVEEGDLNDDKTSELADEYAMLASDKLNELMGKGVIRVRDWEDIGVSIQGEKMSLSRIQSLIEKNKIPSRKDAEYSIEGTNDPKNDYIDTKLSVLMGSRSWREVEKYSSKSVKGGPGSGHFGHVGRPGQVGGSASGEGVQALTNERTQVENELKNYMTMIKDMVGNNTGLSDWKYKGKEDAILQLGGFSKPQELPKKYKYGKQKNCFGNAARLADMDRSLTYNEGLAFTIGFPMEHAWCTDKNNNVIDNMWRPSSGDPEIRAYYGIKFNTDYLWKVLGEKGTYGVFPDYWRKGENNPLKDGFPKGAVISVGKKNKVLGILTIIKGGPGSGSWDGPGQPRYPRWSGAELDKPVWSEKEGDRIWQWTDFRGEAKIVALKDLLKSEPLALAKQGGYTKWIADGVHKQNDPDRMQRAGTMFIREHSSGKTVFAGNWMDYPENFSIKEFDRYASLLKEKRASEELELQKKYGFEKDFKFHSTRTDGFVFQEKAIEGIATKSKISPSNKQQWEQYFLKITAKKEKEFAEKLSKNIFAKQKEEVLSNMNKYPKAVKKGGPGSGSWDGPGDPRFSREGGEVDSKVIVFHGTKDSVLKSILENGLKRNDDMKTLVPGEGYVSGVYCSSSIDTAKLYASEKWVNFQAKGVPVIIEFELPDKNKLMKDRIEGPTSHFYKGDVPKNNILAYHTRDNNKEWVRHEKQNKSQSFYVPILITGEQKHLGISTIIKIQKANFNFDDWTFDDEVWTEALATMGGTFIKEMYDLIGTEVYEGLKYEVGTLEGRFDTDNPEVAKYIENRSYKFAKDINKTTASMIQDIMETSMEDGLSAKEISKLVQEVFEGCEDWRAKVIARTETIRASNEGAVEGYKQSGVVSEKEWLCTQDDRTCDWCLSMNGERVSIDKNFFDKGDEMELAGEVIVLDYDDVGGPPLHPQCRCALIPVIDMSLFSEEELELIPKNRIVGITTKLISMRNVVIKTMTDRAIEELKTAGLYDEDSDYEGMIGTAVEELLKVFQSQGHSGFSASMVSMLFYKLCKGEVLSPLTTNEEEWMEFTDGEYQNKRCFFVFSTKEELVKERAYSLDGIVWTDKDGCNYTNKESRVWFDLPGYPPKTEYRDAPEENEEVDKFILDVTTVKKFVKDSISKGGPGSGNFGHSGRPGLVGGSAPGEGSQSPKETIGSVSHSKLKSAVQNNKKIIDEMQSFNKSDKIKDMYLKVKNNKEYEQASVRFWMEGRGIKEVKFENGIYTGYSEYSGKKLSSTKEQVILNNIKESINGWAYTSGATSSSAFDQYCVKKEFDLKSAEMGHLTGLRGTDKDFLKNAVESNKEDEKGIRFFLREMYNNTQSKLSKMGIESVLLYRGQHDIEMSKEGVIENQKIVLQPLSSFSLSPRTASGFGTSIIAAIVPKNRIFSMPNTGYGTSYQKEVIVLGGGMNATVARMNEGEYVKDYNDKTEKTLKSYIEGKLKKAYTFEIVEELLEEIFIDLDIRNADWLKIKKQKELGILSLIKGGPGSGNFGHSGRPGLVGGSAPGEGAQSSGEGIIWTFHNGTLDVVNKLGLDEDKLNTFFKIKGMKSNCTVEKGSRVEGGIVIHNNLSDTRTGDRIGKVTVSVPTTGADKKSVFIDYVHIDSSEQAKGTGSEILNNIEGLAKYCGKDTINLYADVSVGRYCWATKGFDFSVRNQMSEAKYELENYTTLLARSAGVKIDKKVLSQEIGKLKTAKDISEFKVPGLVFNRTQLKKLNEFECEGFKGKADMHVGKAFMLDEGGLGDWPGAKKL